MGKAIYANIAGAYYQIDQSTREPINVIRMPKTHCTMEHNAAARELVASIWLSGVENTHLQTNRGMYVDMVESLKSNFTTEIPKISDQYIVYIDYTIYNDNDKEINHSCTSKRLETEDAILPLGCAFNNEMVYRRVKSFNPKIEFSVTNHVPFGIMGTSYGKKYTMKINDIAIMQSIDTLNAECYNIHNSMEGNSYDYQSHSIATMLKYNIPVYSSAMAGIELGEFTVSFYPRKVVLDLHLVLANLIVAYDDQKIKDILVENMEHKYPPKPGEEPDPDPGESGGGTEDDDPVFPDPDEKDPADGNYDADENGFYYYYEKCLGTNPDALLVVEDTIPDNRYDPDTMVHQKDVLADVPDAEVGGYVRYVTGFDITKL